MKRAIVLFTVLALCLSLCACGGRQGLASPGSQSQNGGSNNGVNADSQLEDSSESSAAAPGSENGGDGIDAAQPNEDGGTEDAPGGDTGNSGSGSSNKNTLRDTVDTTEKAPDNDQTTTFKVNGRDVTVSFGAGMSANETNGVLCIEYGAQRYYLEDVTEMYGSGSDPSSFLYQYAYTYALQRVNTSFGDVTAFDGEVMMRGSGNVVMGYEGTMTCAFCETVLAFVKLIQCDNGGYAVATGVCDGNNATVFDNIQVR